jgi:hypothetical protein
MLNDYNSGKRKGGNEGRERAKRGKRTSQRKMNECMFKRIKKQSIIIFPNIFFAFMLYGA